ncbi:DUF4397 domain-containing protein [Microbacterium foliorum]|uniref:DUF4397 domain-containing protein n=1 Tax=Microbacterium foliorum TaxID=104336 RepID=A0A0F0KAY1_9MICO|nr:DUF4397 domain-containing protein [Microbacterium foliorum]AXL11827.1 DUF4397 domain-containing protein [Microbacterium foliorum]KJL18033.1 hypothetical protein RN50_03140 [Microbacterium foliorum]
MKNSRSSRLNIAMATGATALLMLVAAPLSSTAATTAESAAVPAATSGQAGWLRLGHLSPDTKSVDVRVSAVSGGSTLFELDGVGYGDVSDYRELPAGSYTVSMVPAGASGSSVPVISETVTIESGTATTVAAYGQTDDLQVRAFDDDLTEPATGAARIRLIQASTLTPEVDVTTTQGDAIARDAKAGSATGYAEIPAGDWTLDLKGKGVADTAEVSVSPGSVTTLFVLDTSDGGLTILPVLDSSSVGDVPDGGVDTGGGYLGSDAANSVAPAKRLGEAL